MSQADSHHPREAVVRITFGPDADSASQLAAARQSPELTDAERAAADRIGAGDRYLAVRLIARRAGCEIVRREVGEGLLQPLDIEFCESPEPKTSVVLSAAARDLLARRLVSGVEIEVESDETSATARACVRFHPLHVPWFGSWVYWLLPFRRRLALANLHRVFGGVVAAERIRRLAFGYYAHFARSMVEMLRLPFMSARKRAEWVRVENTESPIQAHGRGRGLILLTGHFGNWETATVAALKQFPQYAGKFHFVRRALKPAWFDRFITRRFRKAGFGTIPKRGSMDLILKLLGEGAIIVFTFDQHAGRPDGIPVEFLGHPAGTFKSLAILALNTEAPVVPASTWREPDGRHVLRFEDPLPLIQDDENVGEAIRKNTRAYNAALERMLLRHPEQWIWMHRRWKLPG